MLRNFHTCVDGHSWYARAAAGPPGSVERLPVVLVHGFGISSAYFVPFAESLAGHFEVYAPDLPGHGQSATAPRPLDIDGFADALRRWMSTAGIARAALIGHSMGCQVAVELAARYPEAVDRLVLIGPTADREARSAIRMAARLLAGGPHEPASMLFVAMKDYIRMLPRLRHELKALLEHRIEERLPRVQVPVLFVRGENDKVAPQQWVDELASRVVRGGRVSVVPHCGHAAHYGAPEETAQRVISFLSTG